MAMFERDVEDIEHAFRPRWKFPDAVARAWWINLLLGGLGAIVLGEYLMTADPTTAAVTAPLPVSIAQLGSGPAPAQFPPGNTAVIPPSSVGQDENIARDEATPTSITDLLKAAFGAAIAFAWAMAGIWLGMRRVRPVTPVHKSTHGGHKMT
jgi:hypothetical protein